MVKLGFVLTTILLLMKFRDKCFAKQDLTKVYQQFRVAEAVGNAQTIIACTIF